MSLGQFEALYIDIWNRYSLGICGLCQEDRSSSFHLLSAATSTTEKSTL